MEEDNNGPIENPNVPIAINIPIFLAVSDFENFEISPKDWGWKRLEPILPSIINKIINARFLEAGASEIKTEVHIKPQNINARFFILSAKNPKNGCIKDENICEQLKIIVAIGIEIFTCSAIKGIIGFKNPVYISFIKWPPQNQIWGFRSSFS